MLEKLGTRLLVTLALGLCLGACGGPSAPAEPAAAIAADPPAAERVRPGATLTAADVAALRPAQQLLVDLSAPDAWYGVDPTQGALDLTRVSVVTARGKRLRLDAWLAEAAPGLDLTQPYSLSAGQVAGAEIWVCKQCECQPDGECVCTGCIHRTL